MFGLDSTEWTAIGAIGAVVLASVTLLLVCTSNSQAASAKKAAATAEKNAVDAKRQADAAEKAAKAAEETAGYAKRQADAAERAASAATGQAETALRQLRLAIAAIPLDYTPVLLQGAESGPDTEWPWVEIRWNGAGVILNRVLAKKWAAL